VWLINHINKKDKNKMPKQPSLLIYLDEELKEKLRKEAKNNYLDMSAYARFILGKKLNESNRIDNGIEQQPKSV